MSLTVLVRSLDGTLTSVQYPIESSLDEVKKLIAHEIDMDADKLQLTFQGDVMEEGGKQFADGYGMVGDDEVSVHLSKKDVARMQLGDVELVTSSLIREIRAGTLDNVELFLDAGLSLTESWASTTPLYSAIGRGLPFVQLIVDRLKSSGLSDVINVSYGVMQPPLMFAITSGDFDVFHYLLDSGADVSCCSTFAECPLSLVVGGNIWNIDIAKTLLKAGATAPPYCRPLLTTAAPRTEFVELLLQHGYSPSQCSLVEAARAGNVQSLKLLIEAGAPLHGFDDETPLYAATKVGSLPAVSFLLERGMDPNDYTPASRSPLDTAVAFGYNDIARVLVEHGARVDALDDKGETLLSRHPRRQTIVKLLLELGAKVGIGRPSQTTP